MMETSTAVFAYILIGHLYAFIVAWYMFEDLRRRGASGTPPLAVMARIWLWCLVSAALWTVVLMVILGQYVAERFRDRTERKWR
jgi:RsiW-degrading membrane proteinase PrsW (M82 family)